MVDDEIANITNNQDLTHIAYKQSSLSFGFHIVDLLLYELLLVQIKGPYSNIPIFGLLMIIPSLETQQAALCSSEMIYFTLMEIVISHICDKCSIILTNMVKLW